MRSVHKWERCIFQSLFTFGNYHFKVTSEELESLLSENLMIAWINDNISQEPRLIGNQYQPSKLSDIPLIRIQRYFLSTLYNEYERTEADPV